MNQSHSRWVACAVAVFQLSLVAHTRADDVTNRELARTFANFYLRQKDYPKMMEILADHLEQDAGDAEAWNLLGLASLEANQLPQAKHAFYMAVTQAKGDDKGIYLYHYANALIIAGDVQKARDTLRIAEQYANVRDSAKLAQKELIAGRPLNEIRLTQKGQFYGSVSLAVGYDTNVLLAPDNTISLLSASDVASPTVTGMVSGGYLKPDGNVIWDFGGLGTYSYQVNSNAQDYNTAYFGVRADRRRLIEGSSGTAWNFGLKYDISFLNLSDSFAFFNWNAIGNGAFVIKHNSLGETEVQLPAGYRKFDDTFSQDDNDDRTGPTYGIGVTHRRYLGAYQVSAGAKFERQQALGANFRANLISFPLAAVRALPFWGLSGVARFELSFVDYPDNTSERSDTNLRFSLGASKKFGGRWSGSFDYTFMRNASTIDAADFTKHVVTAVVTYDL